MNNKIEVGCLCIVKGVFSVPSDNGCFVVAHKRIAGGQIFKAPNGISYVHDDTPGWLCEGASIMNGWAVYCESKLLRIDDHQEETETQEQEMTV